MTVAAYLNFADFTERSIMPSDDVAVVEQLRPGFIDRRLAYWTSWINARLAKRYATPFTDPVADVVLGWLTNLVTLDAYKARGFNPGSVQDQLIIDDATDAKADIKEAADSETGLFDLPLREGTPTEASGIERGGPLGYSEQSPYAWTNAQSEAGRADDSRGRGQ